jgi:DNA polymerase-3 subunit epsilon
MADDLVPQTEAPRRTLLPDDPVYIQQLLMQNSVWKTRDRTTGKLVEVSIWDMHISHLTNVIGWLDGQVGHILTVLGQDQDALSAPAMIAWLHRTPLCKALDAALLAKRREAERAAPPATFTPSEWLVRPMVSLDIETTGVDIENDRIVSFSIGTSQVPLEGDWEAISQIVDPGVEIPEGARKIHGISTERARAEGIPERDAVLGLVRSLSRLHDTPIIAFNARFDLTILDRSARRYTGQGIAPTYVLDPFVLDKLIDPYRKGKRTLDAVCEHYQVGRRIVHEADEDAQRALRLLYKELLSPVAYEFFGGRFPGLPALQEIQADAYADQVRGLSHWQASGGQVPDVRDDRWPIASLPRTEMVSYDREPPY